MVAEDGCLERQCHSCSVRQKAQSTRDPRGIVFQNKQCRNCHALGGEGGQRGPALDAIATRLTRDEMVRQVIQGGGTCLPMAKKPVRRRSKPWFRS